MYDIFQTRGIRYNLRSQTDLGGYCVNTNRFGLYSLKFFAAKVWDSVPLEIKNSDSVEVFKQNLKIETKLFLLPLQNVHKEHRICRNCLKVFCF